MSNYDLIQFDRLTNFVRGVRQMFYPGFHQNLLKKMKKIVFEAEAQGTSTVNGN